MTNRPLYIRKYHSSRLKEFGYQIQATFDESKDLKEIIGLSDNQILRTIRDINKHTIDKNKLEVWIKTRNHYKKQLTYQQTRKGFCSAIAIKEKLETIPIHNNLTKRMRKKYINPSIHLEEVKRIQNKINRTLFIEDYVTVVMDTPKQYEYLYKNGLVINGKTYRRLSCSAGQARVSTVVFAGTDILEEVKRRLNNGRDMNKKLSPSKFNSYFGLAGSATKVVSEPKFIVVKDFVNQTAFPANYVIENGWNVDDTIVQKELKGVSMNRTDGMGLISYTQAYKWAGELGLDYVPSQFCIRQNFIKGMLCVFPIHEFCEKEAHGNYLIDSIYKDENDKPIRVDLRDYDVILTESQFKLWDCFESLDSYIDNCRKNKLYWGIALTSPKEAKKMLKLNYQFLQTLKLSQKDMEELSAPFVEWITGVSYDNIYYMLLFLLGVNNDADKINHFLSSGDHYWIKALIACHDVKNDRYIRTKVRELIKHKINKACMGDIYVDGNFQVIVSDPYGFMQHVCGLPVTGLLKKGEFYSNYWNEQDVTQVDAMRSPLTYLSEHVILNLRKDEEVNYWYRYCKLGIILNYHGHETFHFAGSDFDMDILATTSNRTMIGGVYKQELPVIYKTPKPKKCIFTEEDLYQADTFSFGSSIGSITNKSSNGYALLPLLEERYGKDSQPCRLIKSRLQQCCKAQSAQIDKAKIGRAVKGIPSVWINHKKIKKNKKGEIIDTHYARKKLYNETLLNRYPYFFRYLYKDTNRQYKKHVDEFNITCKQKYQITFRELEHLEQKTEEQQTLIENFYQYSPVLYSPSSMNLLCNYIEGIDFAISKRTRIQTGSDVYECYKSDIPYQSYYDPIVRELKNYSKGKSFDHLAYGNGEKGNEDYNRNKITEFQIDSDHLYEQLASVCKNPYVVTNCLVDYFYIERPSGNKDLLWSSYGKFIYKNIVHNHGVNYAKFPFPDDKGELQYLGYHYTLQEVRLS